MLHLTKIHYEARQNRYTLGAHAPPPLWAGAGGFPVASAFIPHKSNKVLSFETHSITMPSLNILSYFVLDPADLLLACVPAPFQFGAGASGSPVTRARIARKIKQNCYVSRPRIVIPAQHIHANSEISYPILSQHLHD